MSINENDIVEEIDIVATTGDDSDDGGIDDGSDDGGVDDGSDDGGVDDSDDGGADDS